MTSTATRFPPEILSHIFRREPRERVAAENEDIKNYSLVCSSWRFPAQHELFSTFVITSLNRPRSRTGLPYSTIAKDKRYSHIGPAIHVLLVSLRYPLEVPGIDPDFHLFLAHLTSVHILIFTDASAKILFRWEVFTPQLRNALRNLLRLPTLGKLAVSTPGFPLAVIPSCASLNSLVLFSSTRGTGPLCDVRYDVRDGSRDGEQAGQLVRFTELNLFGDQEYIEGFTTWLRDPENCMSTSELTHVTIQFYRNIPAGPETIFCDFRHVQSLTIQFLFSNTPSGNQTQIDISNLFLPKADIENLINLRSFKAEYPATSWRAEDVRKTVAILSIWVIPFLHCLPSPNLLQSLELYMVTPSAWSRSREGIQQPNPGTAGNFTKVWEKMDAYLDLRFRQLEKLAVFIPWSTHKDVLGMLPKCRQKGIVKKAPYDL